MRKAGKIIVILIIIVLVMIGALLSYVKFALPDIAKAPDLKIEITPARVERGKYLANHVTQCVDCHTKRDFTKFAGPIDHQKLGEGGERFDQQNAGLPGVYYSPNITPFNLRNWTDGEIFRTITTGVNKDGDALFPIMPYPNFGKMDKEDIYSIIAYIRTLPAIESTAPKSKSDFPMNFIINTIPKDASLTTIPAPNDDIEYGRYMINAAGCGECHTPREKGESIPGMEFAGGHEFNFGGVKLTSANITPDNETGIGNWTQDVFVSRFKAYGDSALKSHKLKKGEFQTVMPWLQYSGMKEQDLKAIYTYLRSLKPVKNQVVKFTAN